MKSGDEECSSNLLNSVDFLMLSSCSLEGYVKCAEVSAEGRQGGQNLRTKTAPHEEVKGRN